MVWRDNIASPQGYKYFLVVFDSTAELFDYSIPSWFDTNTMGLIGIYYINDEPNIVVVDGPDTSESAWYLDLGYPVYNPPLAEHNLKVQYNYHSVTYMAFVRNPSLDSFKGSTPMYAWTIADSHWSTVYTDTMECETTTKLWLNNDGVWSQSTDAVIYSPVWIDLVSTLVENEATNVPQYGIEFTTTQDTYSNAVASFVGGLATVGESISITVDGTGWKWEDTDTSESPRTITSSKWGDFFKIVNA